MSKGPCDKSARKGMGSDDIWPTLEYGAEFWHTERTKNGTHAITIWEGISWWARAVPVVRELGWWRVAASVDFIGMPVYHPTGKRALKRGSREKEHWRQCVLGKAKLELYKS